MYHFILNFDWGSQSIAQSNLSKSPLSRKEFKSIFLIFYRQHFFRIIFGRIRSTVGEFIGRFSKNFPSFVVRFVTSAVEGSADNVFCR